MKNTIVDGTKSNKSTVDGNTITDGTNTTETTSSSQLLKIMLVTAQLS